MNERRIHQFFELSVFLKGAHAFIECASGLVLAFVSTAEIKSLIAMFTQERLVEDSDDRVASYLLGVAQDFTVGTQHFYAFYLLSHGVIKLFLVVGLLRGKLWAYPASLVALVLFIAYQLYRYSYTGSPGLIALTVFDIIFIGLIWHEYRMVREHLTSRQGGAG